MSNGASLESPRNHGAGMDRRITRPRLGRRWRWVAGGVAIVLAAGLAWRLLPAAGSTDIAAATIETGPVARAPFEDYLPIRASVAPKVTTLVDTLSGGQVEKLLVQDGAWVNAGQPLATLVNPTLKLDVLTREAEIASQLGTLTGDELSLERSRLDRAAQTASANYDLLKARRDLSIRQQLHDQGFVSDEGVKSYQEEADYQRKRLGRGWPQPCGQGVHALQSRIADEAADGRGRAAAGIGWPAGARCADGSLLERSGPVARPPASEAHRSHGVEPSHRIAQLARRAGAGLRA
ncbi:multidrug efflux pump subunit AcrA (membrane-fusion protein) [Novosphingobium sp. SG720]|nr:multidrug efflux pump subunit AcrA (membrane-fusion protein) [Novosphingobium sp. SG720]